MTTTHVSIESHGRCGTVTYHEAGNRLACHWEFGGTDTVVIAQCGSDRGWVRHPWAQARRSGILQCIADEVVRQKAPGCHAESIGSPATSWCDNRPARLPYRARRAPLGPWGRLHRPRAWRARARLRRRGSPASACCA
jgi:hypothetical protein